MDNPYITSAPATMSDQQINPFFQNTQNQTALNNQLMQQGQQLGQPIQQSGSSNPMALAQALRGMNQSQQSGVSPLDNAKAWVGSKFGRDEMQPNSPAVQNMVEQYYGSGVPNIWSM